MAQDSSRPDFWDRRYREQVTPWDAGWVPVELKKFLQSQPPGRALVPGCGAGYEVAAFADAGWDVVGLDFSAEAVELAKQTVPLVADRIIQADFFAQAFTAPFDLVYERAFLCALPRHMWSQYAHRMGRLIKPGGILAGYFFFDDNQRGPPFGTDLQELLRLFGTEFALSFLQAAESPIDVFRDREFWMIWECD